MSFALLLVTLLASAAAPSPTKSAAMKAAASPDSSATAILGRVAENYRALDNFHFLGNMRVGVTAQGQTQNIEMPFEVAMKKPGKSRMLVQNPMIRMLQVADGENTWMYIPQLGQYTKQAAAPVDPTATGAAAALTAATPLGRYLTMNETLERAAIVRAERVTFDGQPRPAWVIEAQFESPSDTSVKSSPTTFWIDRERQFVLRESTVVHLGNTPNGPMRMNQLTVYEIARMNTPLPDSLFVFTPPAGAKLVEQIAMPGAQPPQESELVGKPAIPFTLPNVRGKTARLADWKGKVVLLDFWASWCGPCRIEMPIIAKLDRELKSKGLVVVGVNVGESRDVANRYLTKNGYTFTALLDQDSKLSERYGATGIPTVVVIDRKGNISSHFIGVREEAVLREALAKAGVK